MHLKTTAERVGIYVFGPKRLAFDDWQRKSPPDLDSVRSNRAMANNRRAFETFFTDMRQIGPTKNGFPAGARGTSLSLYMHGSVGLGFSAHGRWNPQQGLEIFFGSQRPAPAENERPDFVLSNPSGERFEQFVRLTPQINVSEGLQQVRHEYVRAKGVVDKIKR